MKNQGTGYWINLHKEYAGELKAVGHPGFCKTLNELKYDSEDNTMLQCLELIGRQFEQKDGNALTVLDVGAGTGYWSEIASRFFVNQGFSVAVTAVDISAVALKIVRERNPYVETICEDLKTIFPGPFIRKFNLVMACYSLHHLVGLDDFLNALRFAGTSVKPGGFLVLMDPILTLPFSKFDIMDFPYFQGNGIPRHLYLLDDILGKQGFSRQGTWPAVSFLLNGNIQGYGRCSYAIAGGLWKALAILYRSDRLTQLVSKILRRMDRILKNGGFGFSSSVCVYRRTLEETCRG